MQLLFTYLIGIVLGFGLTGIWIGIVLANWTASIIALIWGRATIEKIRIEWGQKFKSINP
jgi:Na+-driven multidrug efflux pump